MLQPTGAWCASPQDDDPLWKTVNQDYCMLDELCDVHYPRLMAKLRHQSEEYAQHRLVQNSASSTGGPETTIHQSLSSRIAQLEETIQELAELKCRLASVVERVRNNLLAYALSEEFTEHDLAKVLQPAAIHAYTYHVADLLGRAKPNEPYTPYMNTIANLDQTINLFKAVKLLHQPTITKTAMLIYEKTKGKPQKDLSKVSLPNWPGMYNCFQSLRKISSSIRNEATKTHGGLSVEEANGIANKIQIVKCFLFNSPEAHKSIQPTETEPLGFEITPFLQKADFELMIEFFSTADYVMDAFKKIVVDHTPYKIIKVDGDGNCFFRAVIKHEYPSISRMWEDTLSLGLRKRLNMGIEKDLQARGKGEQYHFHGFVIENVNDSLTMAKAGVWADHVQVEKLSLMLKRPIELFTFDDVALRMNRQGKLSPGKDYLIGSNFEGQPISLYYTPSPGHYEVIALPQPPEKQTSIDEDLAQLEHAIQTTPSPYTDVPARLLCNTYFRLEAEVALIEEISKTNWLTAREIKQAIDAELYERADQFFRNFARYCKIIGQLGVQYMIAYMESKPDFNLHTEILFTLLEPGPDAIESPLPKLSSRVSAVRPAGVLSTAQRWSASNPTIPSSTSPPKSYSTPQAPPPPPPPTKAAPPPETRPNTVMTTSPLLHAAFSHTPKPGVPSQAYYTLPPAPEAPLLESPHAQAEDWEVFCKGIPSNVLQLRDSFVVGPSLKALAQALVGTKVAYIMAYRCTFDADACKVLGDVNAWPLTLTRVELHGCAVADKHAVALNNHIKPISCSELPHRQ